MKTISPLCYAWMNISRLYISLYMIWYHQRQPMKNINQFCDNSPSPHYAIPQSTIWYSTTVLSSKLSYSSKVYHNYLGAFKMSAN